MAETQRTRAAILALFGDNVTGQVSCQDARDMIITIMETPEFTYPGDFFNEPIAGGITTDETTRGFHLYSQTMHSDYSISFGGPMAYNQVSGNWMHADLSNSAQNPCRGIAADSYASGATDVKVLIKGIVYDKNLTRLSGFIGKPVYLQSAAAASEFGSIDVVCGDSDSWAGGVLGYVIGSITVTYPSIYKWRFDGTGNWAVTGV